MDTNTHDERETEHRTTNPSPYREPPPPLQAPRPRRSTFQTPPPATAPENTKAPSTPRLGKHEPLPVLPLNEVLVAHGKKVERDLVAAANAPPDEALLAKMVSGEVATLLDLQELQAQVARRAVLLIDSSESMLLMVKALRELGPVLTSMSGRVTATLAASASLRAQRRFLEKNPSE